MKLFKRNKIKSESNGSFNVCVFHRRVGEASDVPVFDRQVLYSTIDDVQWSYNEDLYTHKKYLTMTGTNTYLWVFKSTVFEYVYELQPDQMPLDHMCNEKLPELIRKLQDFEEYGYYSNELYDDTNSFGAFALLYNNDRWILPLSKGDFHFIRTK